MTIVYQYKGSFQNCNWDSPKSITIDAFFASFGNVHIWLLYEILVCVLYLKSLHGIIKDSTYPIQVLWITFPCIICVFQAQNPNVQELLLLATHILQLDSNSIQQLLFMDVVCFSYW